jgi:hypothetical protein
MPRGAHYSRRKCVENVQRVALRAPPSLYWLPGMRLDRTADNRMFRVSSINRRRLAALALLIAGPAIPARAQFSSDNVSLHAWLDLDDLTAASGNDCWGYTSPSGREYALMGLNNKTTVVEITNPASPVIVGSISHANDGTSAIKTYGAYAYVSNEGSGGLDVINLSNIDAATNRISLVQRVTTGGLSTAHTLSINLDTGYL